MSALCHNCGASLHADLPLVSGLVEVSWWGAWAAGKRIALSAREAEILYAIVKAGGRPVSVEQLLCRLSPDAISNTVQVMVCRIRRKLGAWNMISTVGHQGYCWDGPIARPLAPAMAA